MKKYLVYTHNARMKASAYVVRTTQRMIRIPKWIDFAHDIQVRIGRHTYTLYVHTTRDEKALKRAYELYVKRCTGTPTTYDEWVGM